jgi:cysteine synthase A
MFGDPSNASLGCFDRKERGEDDCKFVTVFPSGGERYMNSDLFADVREECVAMKFC